MINQTNILAILPTPTVGDAPLTGDISSLGDSTFQDFIKDAVRESSFTRKDDAPARKERPEPPSTEQNKVEPKENHSAQELNSSQGEKPSRQYTEEAGTGNYQETANTRENETANQQTPVSDNPAPIVEQLKDLNISPEKIDAFLEFLNVDGGADVKALLQSLVQQLNLNPEGFNGGSATDPLLKQQQLLSLIKDQGGKAVDLLVKAGLTEQAAQNLLSKIQSTQGTQATLKAGEEAANDVLAKLSGEKAVEGKADFLSQFSDLNNQEDKPQRQASIEKVLTQAENKSTPDLVQKPLEKALATAPKLEEPFQANLNQGNPAAPQNAANLNLLKNNEGVRAPSEVKVQSVNAVSESATRPSDAAKPVSAETLSTRGTTEAKVLHQILNKFSLRSNGPQSEIKIKLDPPSLGTVRMNVSTSGDSVRTVVIAETHAVKQIIENNLTQLRDSMNGQGLKVDSFTVLVGGNNGQAGQQNTPHEGHSHYAGLPNSGKNPALETQAEPLTLGAERIFHGESQSISVFA